MGFALLLLTPVAMAQSPGAQQAIRAVIEAQLAAFQADDAERAFSYAAPEIQARFETPEKFMAMVRAGYDPVYRPSAVEFKELRSSADELPVQHVLFIDRNGRPVHALYPMVRQPNGTWRIGGCMLMPTAGRAL